MKKIIFTIVLLFIFPSISLAYDIDTLGMDSSIASLLKTLEDTWPTGLDEGRIEVIRQAALMINKGTDYGEHTGICYTNTPPSLDCSAYVSLAFHRAGVSEVGCDWFTGSYISSSSFSRIKEEDLRPGDVGLNNDTQSEDNHIGIYIGKLNGQNIWLHSSSTKGRGPQVREGNNNFVVFERYNKWNEVNVSNNSSNSGIGGELGGLLTDPYINYSLESSNDFTCENLFYKVNKNGELEAKTFKVIIDGIFRLLVILAPVIAIVLSIIDYGKILTNNSNDGFKKANIRMIKRIIIAILIIFLPYLLDLLFNIFGLYDLNNCGI